MDKQCIIPLPPGTVATDARGLTRQAVGLYPCLNGGTCAEYLLVKLDARGRPYAYCSDLDIVKAGCSRHVKGLAGDIPEQTPEVFEAAFDRVTGVFPMGEAYRQFVTEAWQQHLKAKGVDHAFDT